MYNIYIYICTYVCIYIYIYGSAPFDIVNITIIGRSKTVTGFKHLEGTWSEHGGNMEGTWQEHDGTDGQTDVYIVPD